MLKTNKYQSHFGLFLGILLVLGKASAEPKTNLCNQDFRQISMTSAHAITALICNLQANSLTEKTSRNLDSSFNFVHQWKINIVEDNYEIEAICASELRYYEHKQLRPIVAHPGYRLKLNLPRFDEKCDPVYSGTISEIYDEKLSEPKGVVDISKEVVRKALITSNVRDVRIRLKDTGFRDTTTRDFHGARNLMKIELGVGVRSIFRSGFTSAGLSQGSMSSELNKMGFGDGTFMSYDRFYYKDSPLLAPDFVQIKAEFQFNKSADSSLANRDSLRISGFSRELYIRQGGVTQSADDPKMEYDYVGGTSAFYVDNYDHQSKVTLVLGCTDYSYSGDYNTLGKMKTGDCRSLIEQTDGLPKL